MFYAIIEITIEIIYKCTQNDRVFVSYMFLLLERKNRSQVISSHFFGLSYFDKVVFCKIKNEVDINIASLLQK